MSPKSTKNPPIQKLVVDYGRQEALIIVLDGVIGHSIIMKIVMLKEGKHRGCKKI